MSAADPNLKRIKEIFAMTVTWRHDWHEENRDMHRIGRNANIIFPGHNSSAFQKLLRLSSLLLLLLLHTEQTILSEHQLLRKQERTEKKHCIRAIKSPPFGWYRYSHTHTHSTHPLTWYIQTHTGAYTQRPMARVQCVSISFVCCLAFFVEFITFLLQLAVVVVGRRSTNAGRNHAQPV